eukprot:111368-Chlamydomonas_euryale.AAC.2
MGRPSLFPNPKPCTLAFEQPGSDGPPRAAPEPQILNQNPELQNPEPQTRNPSLRRSADAHTCGRTCRHGVGVRRSRMRCPRVAVTTCRTARPNSRTCSRTRSEATARRCWWQMCGGRARRRTRASPRAALRNA